MGLMFLTCVCGSSCPGYLVVGLVVLLVVLETFWALPQVQALIRVFTGPRSTELKGLNLDEMVQDWDHTCPNSPDEAPEYALPISTISPCPPDMPSPLPQPPPSPLPPPPPERAEEDLPPDQPADPKK